MIDQEWLGNLDFVRPDGLRIHGLAGVGSEKVALKATSPNGKQLVLKTYRNVLGYHIREVPMLLSETPMYDVNRLNRKLEQLVGDETFDEMTCEYDRLFSSVIRILYQGCTENTESKANVPMVVATLSGFLARSDPGALAFLLATPMINRRLRELAGLTPAPGNPASRFVHVNGPNFPIDALMDEVTK